MYITHFFYFRQQQKYGHRVEGDHQSTLHEGQAVYPSLLRQNTGELSLQCNYPKITENTLDRRGYKVHGYPLQDRDLPRIPGQGKNRNPPIGHVYESPTPAIGDTMKSRQNTLGHSRDDGPVYFDLESERQLY